MKHLWFFLTLLPLTIFGQSTVLDSLKNEPCEVIYRIVEDMPQFPGGDAELIKRVSGFLDGKNCQHLLKTYMRYDIDKNGRPTHLEVDGISDECTRLFIEEFEKLPNWKPGYHRGKPVCVEYFIPVVFDLPRKK